MSFRGAFTTGTVLSLTSGAGLGFVASLTQGPVTVPSLSSRHLWASYRSLAGGVTGNGLELFALTAAIFTLCFFASGLRRIRREAAASREFERAYADAEAAEQEAGWR